MKILSLLFAGARWKKTLIIGASVIAIVTSGIWYVQSLRTTVEDLRESNQLIQRQNREMGLQMDENRRSHEREVRAITRTFEEYNKGQVINEINYQNLLTKFNEIDNEELKECLNTRLPDELVDSLFPTRE